MAFETMRVSDKSRQPIPGGTGARVRVAFYADGKVDMSGDLTDDEVNELISRYKLTEVKPRTNRQGEKRVRL